MKILLCYPPNDDINISASGFELKCHGLRINDSNKYDIGVSEYPVDDPNKKVNINIKNDRKMTLEYTSDQI